MTGSTTSDLTSASVTEENRVFLHDLPQDLWCEYCPQVDVKIKEVKECRVFLPVDGRGLMAAQSSLLSRRVAKSIIPSLSVWTAVAAAEPPSPLPPLSSADEVERLRYVNND